jgi:tRNA 5-methylaminomethyl-2-thiouridine biosynthesis bifunctional protein
MHQTIRPYSEKFSEHYWSPAGGAKEKYAVFVAGNDLAARFTQLSPGQSFAVAELGLGTGLNWALVMQEFRAHAARGTTLHYFGYEAFPLPLVQLAEIHAALPANLAPWLGALCEHWPKLQLGWNCWPMGAATLHLYLGEALVGLPTQPGRADAWFLDGFSPAKNPELWSLAVMQALAQQSHRRATIATYSIARMVRDNLTAAGFTIQKKAGVPPKRDRLEGVLKP